MSEENQPSEREVEDRTKLLSDLLRRRSGLDQATTGVKDLVRHLAVGLYRGLLEDGIPEDKAWDLVKITVAAMANARFIL